MTTSRSVLAVLLTAILCVSCSRQKEASKETHLARGKEYFAAQQYDKAEREFREALRLAPDDADVESNLALIYFEQGQVLQAYPLLKKSGELEPNNPDIQIKLGQALLAFGDYRPARDAALRTLNKRPGDEQALILLADTAFDPKDVEEVLKIIASLREKDQERAGYHLALGALAIRGKNFPTAESEFKAAIQLNPKSSLAQMALATFYLLQNNRAAAEAAFKAAVDLAPVRSFVRLRYADFMLGGGSLPEAKAFLKDWITQAPDYLPPRVLLMKILCSERRDDDCIARVHNVLDQDSINHDALFQDGLINLDKNNPTAAIRDFEYLSGVYARDEQARFQLAVAYLASAKSTSPVNGRIALENAESKLNEAIKIDPNFAKAIMLLAELKMRKGTPAAAVDLLLPLIRQHPQVPQIQYLLAAAYVAQQQGGRALAVYRHMSDQFPKDPQPPFLVGTLLLSQKQNAEARRQFEKSLEISAGYLPAIEMLVNFDISSKQYDGALQRVQQLIDRDSKDAQGYALRGKIYLAQRDFAHAESDLKKAIELSPDFQPAYVLLTQLYITSNQQAEALNQLKAWINNSKDKAQTVTPLFQLGMLQQNLKQFSDARDNYEKLLAINPNYAPALNNLALLYSEDLNQPDKAYELARKASEQVPNEPQFADTYGWILFKRGEYRDALTHLVDSARKLTSPEAQYHLGMANYMLGQEESAQAALQRAVDADQEFAGKQDAVHRLAILAIDPGKPSAGTQDQLDRYLRDQPKDPWALFKQAQLLQQKGSADAAIKTYQAIFANNPDFGPAQRELAVLFSQQTSPPPNAVEIARKARETYPEDARLTDAVGWLEFKNGSYETALPLLRASAEKLPNDAEVQYHLGILHLMAGDIEAARSALQKALGTSRDFFGKAEAQKRLALLSMVDRDANPTTLRVELTAFLKEHPNDPFALFQTAKLAEQEGATDQATRDYEKLLAANPNFAPALRQLALLYGHKVPADVTKAVETATRARRAFPNDPEITKTLGILDFSRAYYPQAADQLRAAAATRKDDPELLYYLGQAYRELRRLKECQEATERALQLNLPPNFVEQAKRTLTECSPAK